MITLGLGLFGVLWAITKLANGPFDASTAGFLIGGLALIVLFVFIESRVPAPMLPLRIFKVPTMAASLCASLFQGLASFAVLFLLLMYLQGPRGLSPIHASLLLLPGYLISAGISIWAGRLADKYGAVLPATAGLALQVVSLLLYAQLTNSTPLWWIVIVGTINAIGACLFFPANSSAIMKAAPPDMFGIASGMMRTFANVGMVFSFSVAILVASRSISRQLAFAIFVGTTSLHGQVADAFTTGLHAAFYAMVIFMVIAAVLSALRAGGIRRPGRSAARTPSERLRSRKLRQKRDNSKKSVTFCSYVMIGCGCGVDLGYSQPFLMLPAASPAGARPSSPARTLSSMIRATPTIVGAMSLRLAASDGPATSCGTSARSSIAGRSASSPASQPNGSADSSLRNARGWGFQPLNFG
jgi:MFS family permease